jgi:polysaccharide pyruvyl transferase WcaK-like protein
MEITTKRSALIVSPVIPVYHDGKLSLGDELLVLGAINALKCSGNYDGIGIAISDHIPISSSSKAVEDFIIGYGNNVCNDNQRNVSLHYVYTSYDKVPDIAPKYDLVAFIGADCMDGYYNCKKSHMRWETIFHTSQFTESYLISTSFETAKAKQCAPILKTLNSPPHTANITRLKFFPRDSPSYQSLREFLSPSLTNSVYASADLAFNVLLDANIPNHFESQLAREVSNDERVTIGVNINIHKSSGISMTSFIPHVVKTLCEINTQKRLRIVYVAHDYRVGQSDIDVGNQFVKAVSHSCPALAPYVYHEPTKMLNAVEAKSVMAACDLVMTARMHVSISTISSGVPVLILGAHQTKFQYLERLFDLHSSIVSKSSPAMTNTQALYKVIKDSLDTLHLQRENITKNLPEVKIKSKMFTNV